MSGDVQPRKRKDKKKKKDELGLEEPRGTAAALGEGDVFMHSYSDHGTGGHWCAKIIFFSLLVVLVTLVGLIILENRGLSELEANAVESRYSNILEGWLEDAPDDDHHDEHTLELKHHDDDEEDDHYNSHDVGDHEDEDHAGDEDDHEDEDEDDHADEDEDDHADDDEDEYADEDEDEHAGKDEDDEEDDAPEDDDSNADEDDNTQEDDDDEQDIQQDLEDDEYEDERRPYKYYNQDEDDDEDDTRKDDDEEAEEDEETAQDDDEDEHDDENESNEEFENEDEDGEDRDIEGDEDEEINENDDNEEDNLTKEDEDEHEDHEEEEDEVEVEKIERETSEEEPISVSLPVLKEEDDDDDKDDDHDETEEDDNETGADDDENDADDDFVEVDGTPPAVERVTAPAGKPFIEVDEDDVSAETPPDTLEEEEEYEKQQEELRKEEEQSSHHIWLKLTVGAALLVATHAVLRRATAPRDEPEGEREEREETPIIDRRMTLIPEQAVPIVVTKKESEKPIVEEIVRSEAPVVKAPTVVKQESEEEEEIEEPELEEILEEEEIEEDEPVKLEAPKKEAEQELYSEEEDEEEVVVPKKEASKVAVPPKLVPEPEEDPDDVEIIDDEQLEEELEEEEDDVSDVDDAELLSRLEAKYGRLPEPERPGQRHKDGGNSVEDAWPGEPADAYWRQQLDSAERELRQGAWSAALSTASAGALAGSARARFVAAAALDRAAEARRDNTLLSQAIAAYFRLLEMSERLPDKKLVEVARRTLDRIQFRGNYLKAEPVYRLLIRRFPNEPAYRNNLTISYLMANRNDLAENVLKETLVQWPDDRVALAHYAYILKTTHKDKLEEAVELFQKALDGDKGPACEPRFYYHFGDALLLLGRFKEAHEVHRRGAKFGHFLSPSQRSLYNVPRLKSRPWWNVNETPYAALAKNLEKRWKEILKEGQLAAGLFKEEEEGLRERGEWGQMDLFVRGREVPGRCKEAPVTCSVVRGEAAAAGCRRGQVKFSNMAAGTHVRAHVGPTNCRLRMHLGLSNTKNTYLRVDQETRQWQDGKVLLFDDSFEHEVWHNGTGPRLVLIVDVWHPDLTAQERRTLPPI